MKKNELQVSGFGGNAVRLRPTNCQLLAEGSPFSGLYQSDDYKAYVEFDICHSLPVVAGPASVTGNYVGWHPAALARSHSGLIHQQTNLHHLIKKYAPKRIARDRIVGAVVATYYPAEPSGGWGIPETKEEAVPIKVLAVVFKQAEGVEELLSQADVRAPVKQEWSVSIEQTLPRENPFENMGIYVPSERKVWTLYETPEEILEEAVSVNDDGHYIIGKYKGEQLAFVYGAVEGNIVFQGVGYTPRPAEAEARITSIRLNEMENDVLALRAEAVDEMVERFQAGPAHFLDAGFGDALEAIKAAYPRARKMEKLSEGAVRLPGCLWSKEASEADPVYRITLSTGQRILKNHSEVVKKLAAKI